MIYPKHIQQSALAIITEAAKRACSRGTKVAEEIIHCWYDYVQDGSIFADEVGAQLQAVGFRLA